MGVLYLLQLASLADPLSPSAFSSHLTYLYKHAYDGRAAALLDTFERAASGDGRIGGSRSMLRNESSPSLLERAQTLNKQVALMRKGVPAAAPYATKAAAQDAAVEAFLQAAALNPLDGDVWNDLGTSLFFAGGTLTRHVPFLRRRHMAARGSTRQHVCSTQQSCHPCRACNTILYHTH